MRLLDADVRSHLSGSSAIQLLAAQMRKKKMARDLSL